ncbi:hypothetical protein OSB04_016100 [Centaurea solstitialis]|uniref:Uncharacterized protein n=1 Tax=Centaurea solstitialis TaxID=347529 RepID=A0AA38TC69_9ASTR|nr:hypothetical protein OSB04_016100 [Centaurea solstitialis]
MEASALFSTSFRPPSNSLHLRSRLLSKSISTTKPLLHLRPPPTTATTTNHHSRLFLTTTTTSKPYFFTKSIKSINSIISASSASSNSITESPKPQLQGAKIVPLALSIAIGLLIRFVVPKPVEVTPQAWQLLAIFASTIAGLVLSPLPVGAWLCFDCSGDAQHHRPAGGVFLPIIKSLSLSAGSKPNDPSSRKLGSYLIQSQFQIEFAIRLAEKLHLVDCFTFRILNLMCAGNSSALYLTAAAQKPLVSEIGGGTWRLEAMGPVTTNEWVMIGTMLLAVSLWVFGDAIGIASVVTAMLGLSVLLLLGVLEWDDCLSEKSAWVTLTWFAVLVGMAGQLTNLGIVSWMSNCVAKFLQSFSLSWPAAFGVLQAAYFVIHYMFASQTGHVGALYSAFLAMHLAAGVPAILAALALAYNTNLFGAQTHYSSGQAAVYFGAGYVELPDVFRIGFIMACINAVIWTVVGGVWWKFLGLY